MAEALELFCPETGISMANRTITSVQIALPIVGCLPAVSRHSRLFEARVTPDVSHGSRLVNP